jgi:hypothetical protein
MRGIHISNQPGYECVDVYYGLQGTRLIPSQLCLPGKVEIVNANDPGDIGQTGKYKGKPIPYGVCNIHCTARIPDRISYLAKHLTKHQAQLKAAHATSIVYWILWRGIQGNMELTVNELARLAEMKVPVAMDYIQMED